MKRKELRSNPASPKTKKTKQLHELHVNSDHPRVTVESQVLAWDGILAALTFSVPFVVVISINLQAAIAITAVLAAVLIPVSMLACCLREKLNLPAWLVAPVCALVSVGITAFASVYIRSNHAQINDALGMYLHLTAAYPVISAVFFGKRTSKLGIVFSWALRNIIYFGIFTCLTGLVRELIAYNRFAGIELDLGFKMEAAKMPFFGFIVFAFLLAAVAAVYRLASGRMLMSESAEDEEYSGIELEVMQEAARLMGQGRLLIAAEKEEDDADSST